MKILAIETSCDETGISILENTDMTVSILGNALSSQIEIHAQYGGVFPALAKRAHAEKIVPLITQALDEAYLLEAVEEPVDIDNKLSFLDEKETQLKENIEPFLKFYKKPDIDYIAVTVGPGLEPALWVGVNTARALANIWDIPVMPINHMEGHIVTATFVSENKKDYRVNELNFPILSLLVSGGHTELVLSESLGSYKKIGQTRDDAVGEAFDKVARMLGLSYPGGPAVSKLAAQFRENNIENKFELPRPMLHSQDYDFSFSGIKTAVLYLIRDLEKEGVSVLQNTAIAEMVAAEFENAVVEVLIKKTLKAVEEYQVQTIIVGGGVAGNTYLRSELSKSIEKKHSDTKVLFPEPWLATDNAVMIGMAAMMQVFSEQIKTRNPSELRADGNLSF